MQILQRHGHIFGETAIPALDTHNTSFLTVAGKILPAEITVSTATVDFRYDSFSHKIRGRSYDLFHPTHKFMPQDSTETHITFDYLDIGIAYTCHQHSDQGFISLGDWLREILPPFYPIREYQSFHAYTSWNGNYCLPSLDLNIAINRYYGQ
jgi:hypothetical protein